MACANNRGTKTIAPGAATRSIPMNNLPPLYTPFSIFCCWFLLLLVESRFPLFACICSLVFMYLPPLYLWPLQTTMVRLGCCACNEFLVLRSGLVLKRTKEDHTLLIASLENKVYSLIGDECPPWGSMEELGEHN